MRRAYDDAAGLTAAFDLNVLNVANQVAGTDFDVSAFEHRSFWNDEHHRIEMHLVSRRAQRVSLGDGGVLDLSEGQAIVTEHSYKHPPARVQAWFDAAGFDRVERLGIPGEAYGVWLASIDRDPPGCSAASDGGDDASR